MRILNTRVYGLDDSIIRSGYPHSTKIIDMQFYGNIFTPDTALTTEDIERAARLGNTPAGTGHDSYLKGIIVQADFIAPCYWWPQFQRYHFSDIISSQSKMHRITKMDIAAASTEDVDPKAIAITKRYIERYLREPTDLNFEKILANCFMGLELGAGITTNYLQIKTWYVQRRKHRLKMWREVIAPWIEQLPMFKTLCLKG